MVKKYKPFYRIQFIAIIFLIFFGLFIFGYGLNQYGYHPVILDDGEVLNSESEGRVIIITDVPFTAQAPLAEWNDSRQKNGSEEAVALMATLWAKGKKSLNKQAAKTDILNICDFEESKNGNCINTSINDTAQIIFREYFNHQNLEVQENVQTSDILHALNLGELVVVPVNGRLLNNHYYIPPGPERHNIIIKGYDYRSEEFITNDPGTRHGEGYRYNRETLFNAIRDYPTGNFESIDREQKNMIIVRK